MRAGETRGEKQCEDSSENYLGHKLQLALLWLKHIFSCAVMTVVLHL